MHILYFSYFHHTENLFDIELHAYHISDFIYNIRTFLLFSMNMNVSIQLFGAINKMLQVYKCTNFMRVDFSNAKKLSNCIDGQMRFACTHGFDNTFNTLCSFHMSLHVIQYTHPYINAEFKVLIKNCFNERRPRHDHIQMLEKRE